MDNKEEYHDPDYPGTAVCVKEEVPEPTEEDIVMKIKSIVCREFSKEIEIRQSEVNIIDQRLAAARRRLHQLRYTLVSNYYGEKKLQLSSSQIDDEVATQQDLRARTEVSSMLRDGQKQIHPSVKKLLGKKSVDLEEIFRHRGPRNKSRKDYSAMVRTRNYTVAADSTKSLRPDPPDNTEALDPQPQVQAEPKKIPRHLQPSEQNVLTLDDATRNRTKHRYRIIIGNTSKYAPGASRADRSTHKWLLYVRGAPPHSDVSGVVTSVVVTLHHSYAPHHTVTLLKPPYHVSRRGWGEFPARLELHFALPGRNRPATVEHTIKLDRNYTGLQTLGAETIVDVWLYSTQDMLQYEYKDDIQIDKPLLQPKTEPADPPTNAADETNKQTDNWLDFFSKDTTELDVDEMIIKPVKKENIDNDLENQIHSNYIEKIKEEPRSMYEYEDATEEQWAVNFKYNTIENPSENIPNEILCQPVSPKKKIMKYLDPTTGKVYYLEVDKNLDLSKVQEIVINSKGNVKTAKISPIKPNGVKNVKKPVKKGVSLLKPEVKNLLKTDFNNKNDKKIVLPNKNFSHIQNDHCYLGTNWTNFVEVKQETVSPIHKSVNKTVYECLCVAIEKFNSVKVAVNYMLQKIPLVTEDAKDPEYTKHFPFAVQNEDRYWRLDFAKRRNIEWSRAKLINALLKEHLKSNENIWRTKQILVYSRVHGYYPTRSQIQNLDNTTNEFETKYESNIKEVYSKASEINSLTVFDSAFFNNSLTDNIELSDSDEEIDVVDNVTVKPEKLTVKCDDSLTVLPVETEEERLRYFYVEKTCADIGIELRNEDVGHGYSYSAVHAVILSAFNSFAEELIRSSLAEKLMEERTQQALPPTWVGSSSSRPVISLQHVYRATQKHRLKMLSSRDVATVAKQTYSL